MFSERGGGQDGEVEPSQVAVDVFCGDAPEAAEEILELAVAAVHRPNVQRGPRTRSRAVALSALWRTPGAAAQGG